MNEQIVSAYQKTRHEVDSLQSANKTLELAQESLQKQLEEKFHLDKHALDSLANKTFAAVKQQLEEKRNNIDITRLQKEWELIKQERDNESRVIKKLIEGLKKTTKTLGESGRFDQLFEYLDKQFRELKETNRNQTDYFESLTQRFQKVRGSSSQETTLL